VRCYGPRVIRVCFVCLGNICRSPTAEGVFRALAAGSATLADGIEVSSAGLSGAHAGEPYDARSREAAGRRGIVLDGRSRRFEREDFARHDCIVAVDRAVHSSLLRAARTPEERARVVLLRDFDPASPRGSDVPDPYHGGPHGFDHVLDLCEAACRGLLAHLEASGQRAG
jgi:protein-tyrosine phosphatase